MKEIALLVLVMLVACQSQVERESTISDVGSGNSEPIVTDSAAYTIEKISKHNSKEDCWLLIDGKVYDVTDFIQKHPGRDAILEGCGIDSTELYETRPMGSGTAHSDRARSMLEDYYIGDLNS